MCASNLFLLTVFFVCFVPELVCTVESVMKVRDVSSNSETNSVSSSHRSEETAIDVIEQDLLVVLKDCAEV